MRWSPLARKEFNTLLQSKGLGLLSLVLIVTSYFSIGGPSYVSDSLGPNITLAAFQLPVVVFGGFGTVLISYRSIINERESGSIKFVSGMPLRRYEILIGKIFSRTAALCIPVLLTFVIVGLVGTIQYGSFSLSQFVLLLLVSILYVLANVCIGTSISAIANTSIQAATTTFSYYIIFILGWIDFFTIQLYSALTGVPVNPLNPPASEFLFILHRGGPSGAYNVLTNAILGVGNSASWVTAVIADQLPNTRSNALVVDLAFTGQQPMILDEPLALLSFAFWIIIPLLIGGYAFQRTDLA